MIDISTFFQTEPFAELVTRHVHLDAIRAASCQVRIASTNWDTGELRVLENKEITHSAVLASAAIPGIFPTVDLDGNPYVDGGILLNTPLKPAIDAGADVIHVIALDPTLSRFAPGSKPSTIDTLERLLCVAASSGLKTDLKLAKAVNKCVEQDSSKRRLRIHVYRPAGGNNGIFGMLDFSKESVAGWIARGVDDARNHDCARSGCVV